MLVCVFEAIIRFNGFERFSEKFETKTNMEKSHTKFRYSGRKKVKKKPLRLINA